MGTLAVAECNPSQTGTMTMTRIQLHGPISVDAMAPTPRTVLDRLREMLAAGVDATPDAHRPNFYTVGDSNLKIYFYISMYAFKAVHIYSRLRNRRTSLFQAT